MSIQHLVIILIFFSAMIYLARLVYQHFQSGSDCPKGCGACQAIDLDRIKSQVADKSTQA